MEEQKFNSLKKLTINVDSTYKFLQVFNGILNLTDKELLVLAKFIEVGDPKDLCSIDAKKIVAESLGIKDFNTLNNYIKRLKDKRAIFKRGSKYFLSSSITPSKVMNIQINFKDA